MIQSYCLFTKRQLSLVSITLLLAINAIASDVELDENTPPHPIETNLKLEAIDKPTVAPNLDLKEVAPLPEPVPEPIIEPGEVNEQIDDGVKVPADSIMDKPTDNEETETLSDTEQTDTDQPQTSQQKKLVILGAEVPKNSSTRLAWSPQITISGLALPTPVLVINGAKDGPTVCLTSAIHGDELNGIEVVRRVMYNIDPGKLAGTLIGVPIVNLQGFQRTSRYLSDRRDLNRYFPGEPNGSLASRIAFSLFTKVIRHCDYLIDLHTGSFRRNNLPQIRANMSDPKVAEFVSNFDKIAIVHHAGGPGMLRTVANYNGIVALTMELGESLRIQENQIEAGTYSINSMLDKLEMYTRAFIWGDPKPTYYESLWLRAESGGILFSEMDLGDRVSSGDVLGFVTDPITNLRTELVSPVNGNIIGMAVNQVVIPGFAAYHIGIESTQEDMAKSEHEPMPSDIGADGEAIEPE